MPHDSLSDLLELFDRQVAFLLDQDDARLIVALPQFIEFLDGSDARLSSVMSVLRSHVRTREMAFVKHDRHMRAQLKRLWPRCRALVEKIQPTVRNRRIFHVHGDVAAFERRLDERTRLAFPTHKEVSDDPRMRTVERHLHLFHLGHQATLRPA